MTDEAQPDIERSRPDPEQIITRNMRPAAVPVDTAHRQALLVLKSRRPETDVVPAAGNGAFQRYLKCQILLTAKQVQAAHRRVGVRPIEDNAKDMPQYVTPPVRIGDVPANLP